MLLHICPWLQMSQHSGNIHLLTGFPIAEVNSQINPNNRSPPSLEPPLTSELNTRCGVHNKDWPMKITVTSPSIILDNRTYPHRVPCGTYQERFCHFFKVQIKKRSKKDIVITRVRACLIFLPFSILCKSVGLYIWYVSVWILYIFFLLLWQLSSLIRL